MGIDLDGDNDACDESKFGTEANMVDGKCPRARLTGVIFDVAMHYFNNDLSPNPPDQHSVMSRENPPPYCIVELTPTVGYRVPQTPRDSSVVVGCR